jgi:hypothetical protein
MLHVPPIPFYMFVICLFNIHFNITLVSMSRSLIWALPMKLRAFGSSTRVTLPFVLSFLIYQPNYLKSRNNYANIKA